MAHDTSLLDQALARRRQRLEQERENILAQLMALLPDVATSFGIRRACIFGSVVKAGRFHEKSDVDLAVEMESTAHLPELIAVLSRHLERQVDVVDLGRVHFAERIRKGGILWMPNHS